MPPVVDGERVSSARDLDELCDAGTVQLPLVGGVRQGEYGVTPRQWQRVARESPKANGADQAVGEGRVFIVT
jgi:hypothetical protein